jgi:ferritin-like metal-binding protein YciE
MAQGTTLRDLLIDEIRDLYDAERQLVKALPKMAKGATSQELRSLIETHLGETEEQVTRLERAFEMLGEKPRGKRCEGIAGIIEEGSNLLEEDFDGAVLDAGIIAGAQRAEHYEITAYGSVMAWAKQLGENEIAELLSETLEEEKSADEKLSALAEGTINVEAAQSEGEDAESDEEDEDTDRQREAGTARRAGGDMRMSAASSPRGSGAGRSSGKGGSSGSAGGRRRS